MLDPNLGGRQPAEMPVGLFQRGIPLVRRLCMPPALPLVGDELFGGVLEGKGQRCSTLALCYRVAAKGQKPARIVRLLPGGSERDSWVGTKPHLVSLTVLLVAQDPTASVPSGNAEVESLANGVIAFLLDRCDSQRR